MNICGDFTGIRTMSGCVKEEALSFPRVHKISSLVGEGESGQDKVCLSSRVQVVLPEILGSLSIINRTSAEFSRKRDVEQSNCYK